MKREIVWLVVSCLMVAALLLASCAPAVTKEKEAAPPGEEEVTEEETVTFEQPFSIGETAQTSRVAVTVLDAIIADSYQYYDLIAKETRSKEASPGMSFLIATLEIENVGRVLTREGKLKVYALDAEVPRYATGSYYGEGPLAGDLTLDPGKKIGGKVLFEIRKGATGLKIVYARGWFIREPLAEWEIK